MGVYEIALPRSVRNVTDLVDCFRALFPELNALTRSSKDGQLTEAADKREEALAPHPAHPASRTDQPDVGSTSANTRRLRAFARRLGASE
jgi:hypothetical protein